MEWLQALLALDPAAVMLAYVHSEGSLILIPAETPRLLLTLASGSLGQGYSRLVDGSK